MKKVISVAVMFTLFMGVASAASINGDYKGSPIVKIYSQGIEIKSDDVPPMIYNGRTVVPMSVLTKLGISLDWNQKDYKLRVFMPEVGTAQTTETINSKNFNTIQKLKVYSKIQNNFYKLETLGERINSISDYLSLAHDAISADHNIVKSFSSVNSFISNVLSNFSELVSDTTSIVKEAQDNDIDIMVMKDILTSYSESLELYMTARDGLTDYSNTKKTNDFNVYLNNYSDAYDKVIEALNKSNKGYNEYFSDIQY